jgi:hypothetical protein
LSICLLTFFLFAFFHDLYDILLIERAVLKRKEDFEQEQDLVKADSREELQAKVLVRMKSVTGGKDDICISMLESNGYDLKTSVEAYFLQPPSSR